MSDSNKKICLFIDCAYSIRILKYTVFSCTLHVQLTLTVLVCLQKGGCAAGAVSRCGEAESGTIVPGELPETAD